MTTWIERSSKRLGEHYFHTVHKSGLPVYVFPKRMTGTYALLGVKYGSVDNWFCTSEESAPHALPEGIAHFLEHKLFENEDGSDSFAKFSMLGADANAYTAYDRTAYLFSCTENFEACLEELLRFVTHPYFTEASIQKEQGIIGEEIRMYDDHPWERGYRNLLRALYLEHPVRNNICGSRESIARITPELLYECCRIFYRPSNMALVICGDVECDAVMRVVDEAFPDLPPRGGEIVRSLPSEPSGVATHSVSDRMQVSKPIFSIGIKDTVIPRDPVERLRRDAAMAVLNEVLFSRCETFYSTLFEEGILTPTFSFGYSGTDSFAFNCISGESDHPTLVLERLWAYLETVKREGISRESFERCKRVLYADEIRAYDSTEEIAENLLPFVFDGAELFDYPELISEVTLEDVTALLNSFFKQEQTVLSVVYPLEDTAKEDE